MAPRPENDAARNEARNSAPDKAGSGGRDEAMSESRRILARIGRESDASVMTRVRDHVAARDVDDRDPVELWGTRIGRFIAVSVLVIFILWLLFYVLGG